MSADIEAAVRCAVAILDRASDSWHNGDPRADGPLHWPVAVREARALLQGLLANTHEAQGGTSSARATPDALLGMAWWNALSRPERSYWLDAAGSAVAADAWDAFKRQAVQP